MESATVPRPIASSAYSFVRFCGGAIAPFVAGKLAEHVSAQSPFYLGAAMTAIAVGMLWFYRASLVPVAEVTPDQIAIPDQPARSDHAATADPTARPRDHVGAREPAGDRGTLVVAVGGASAREVCALIGAARSSPRTYRPRAACGRARCRRRRGDRSRDRSRRARGARSVRRGTARGRGSGRRRAAAQHRRSRRRRPADSHAVPTSWRRPRSCSAPRPVTVRSAMASRRGSRPRPRAM